jgi:hypothetical protein
MSLIEANPVMREIYTTGFSTSSTRTKLGVHSHLCESHAEALYRMVLQIQPRCCVEIGMAFGLSSLAILSALKQIGRGRLISVDPGQSSQWGGAGLEAVRRSRFSGISRIARGARLQSAAMPFGERYETRLCIH